MNKWMEVYEFTENECATCQRRRIKEQLYGTSDTKDRNKRSSQETKGERFTLTKKQELEAAIVPALHESLKKYLGFLEYVYVGDNKRTVIDEIISDVIKGLFYKLED